MVLPRTPAWVVRLFGGHRASLLANRRGNSRTNPHPQVPASTVPYDGTDDFPLDDDQVLLLTTRDGQGRTRNPTVHLPDCGCDRPSRSCPIPDDADSMTAAEELLIIHLASLAYSFCKIGATLTPEFFAGSPQQNGILNKHLVHYMDGRRRAQQTTPFNIPNSQHHLLQTLGMEVPQPDAPEAPHALHKCIELGQLRRLKQFLPPSNYGIISVKDSKLVFLPPPGPGPYGHQHPAYEAKDSSRYPGKAIKDSTFKHFPVHLLHDVSSVVTPHELVEKLSVQNPEGHLIVTGMNPVEVLDRRDTFEPTSHLIDYDLGDFTYMFVGSENEGYTTPIDVTTAWLRTSSVVAKNGRVYHVVLLDNKLGHCVWHIFCGDVTEQQTRIFPIGSYVRVPRGLSGTLSDEYLPMNLVTGILDFDNRTTVLTYSNSAAKVSQLAGSMTPRTTARERWIATHLARVHLTSHTWQYYASSMFWKTLYFVSFQWYMLGSVPDTFTLIDERKRNRIIHPTQGGGWSPSVKCSSFSESIPNEPTMLQRLSALTGSVFTFLVPKIIIGDVLSWLFFHVDIFGLIHDVVNWTDFSFGRAVLTAAIVTVSAIIPGNITKIFTRLAGHYWRQLWWPAWTRDMIPRFIQELVGAPGHQFLRILPGRGWAWQSLIWLNGLHAVLSGLVPGSVVPYLIFFTTSASSPTVIVFTVITALLLVGAALENLAAWYADPNLEKPTYSTRVYHEYRSANVFVPDDAGPWQRFHAAPALRGTVTALRRGVRFGWYHWNHFCLWYIGRNHLGNCGRVPVLPAIPSVAVNTIRRRNVDVSLPAVLVQPSNIPAAPQGTPLAVSPDGLTYVEWTRAVEAAYRLHPNAYPALTPGSSCFYDCVAHHAGTSAMWYSWYMAYFQKTPDPNAPIGEVTMQEIQNFCAASKFGLALSGIANAVSAPGAAGWPTLTLRLTGNALAGTLHVEVAMPEQSTLPIAALARVLATIRVNFPAWYRNLVNAHNTAAADSTPRPTPQLITYLNTHDCPTSYDEVAQAFISCMLARPIALANDREGFGFPRQLPVLAPRGDLFIYGPNIATAPIGESTLPSEMSEHQLPAKTSRQFAAKAFGAFGPAATSAASKNRYQKLSNILLNSRIGHSGRRYVAPWSSVLQSSIHAKIGAVPRPNTRRQTVDNAIRNNEVPRPARWTELRSELEASVKDYLPVVLPCIPLEAEHFNYTADIGRATRLAADLRANPGELGTAAAPDIAKALDAIVDLHRLEGTTVSIPVVAYLGTAGCGKTRATLEFLKTLTPEERGNVRVVSHTESLRADAKEQLDFPEMRGFNFPTLTNILLEPSSGTIIFDDAGQVWGGVLDLVILANPLVDRIVINGDPAQGHASFAVAGTQSKHDLSAINSVALHTTKYATLSHRYFQLLANTLGMYTTSGVAGFITHSVGPKLGIPVCTASPRYVNVLDAAGRHAETYQTVQGESYSMPIEIDATGLEGAILPATAYVAFTRSKQGVYLRMAAADPNNTIKSPPTGSDMLNAIVYEMRAGNTSSLQAPSSLVKACFYKHLHTCMPRLPWFATIGTTLDPTVFEMVLPAASESFPLDTVPEEPVAADDAPFSTAPEDNHVAEFHPWAKEHRETGSRYGQTDQFKDNAFVNPHDHKRRDTATYKMSVEARLSSATREENAEQMKRVPRRDMIAEFDRLVPRPPKWNSSNFEGYVDRSVEEYTSRRTVSAVLAKIAQHDPDRTASSIKISLKNQVIKKAEKMNKVGAIPGQLVHEFDILATLADSAYALWLEDHLPAAFPKNFIFYRRMNPQEFIDVYLQRWRVGNGAYGSDATRWDVGCDAGMLNFDLHVMRSLNFPEWYIAAYKERRLSAFSQHGPMKTMQPSGDRWTWILNTIRRAVVTSIVCQVKPEDTVVVNGDDAAMDRTCVALPFPDSPWAFKDINGPEVEFSGFLLGGPTPTYSAHGLYYRTEILKSRDPSAKEKWESYLDLLQFADPESTYAAAVARDAKKYLDPKTFWDHLPKAFLHYFESLDDCPETSLLSTVTNLFRTLSAWI